MAGDPYDELADRIRRLAREEATSASPPVERAKVQKSNPLVVELIGEDLRLEEGDPDVEIDEALLTDRPAVGRTVRVHRDAQDDYVIAGVIR